MNIVHNFRRKASLILSFLFFFLSLHGMNLSQESLKAARELLCGSPLRVVVVSHTNPDGDAIGSSLALREALMAQGHSVTCIVPNKYPYYLDWISGISNLLIFKGDHDAAIEAVKEADVIICADMSMLTRLEELGDVIAANTTAKRVLIDHHLSPDPEFDVIFSHPESSSTAFLAYCIIVELFGKESVTPVMAEQLYVGMMTDTGNFSFSFLTPELFRAVADLSATGINIPQIYNNVYNSFTEGRARLFGYVINRKMKTLHKGTVAYMSLTEEEMRRFWFQQGDSEGFVNYPLTIKKMKMSAIFIEHHDFIRVSLRSRGNVDVNEFSRRYFNGGGHKNAAGGKSFVSMDETIAHYIASVKEFVEEGGLSQKD